MKYDYLIAGAGFAGSVTAERIANILGAKVLVAEKRGHVAGNAYDFTDENGILVQQYGPHIFHTNDKKVFEYLSGFTEWKKYEHRVVSRIGGKDYPVPVNMITLNLLYGLELKTEDEVKNYFDSAAEKNGGENSEKIITGRIGRDLYEKFFEKFTEKIWFEHPSNLAPNVCGRINVRYNDDCRYFTDKYQYMPANGFTKLVESMLDNPMIDVKLNTDFRDVDRALYGKLVYTGPIDAYFGYEYGILPYRGIKMVFEKHDKDLFQKHAVINFPGDEPFYRITEFKHITGGNSGSTTICTEYSDKEGERFYPKRTPEALKIFSLYKNEAAKLNNVYFTGMHPAFQYYDVGQVVAMCLKDFSKLA
ncbi:MAG: UDP-galactopyranose mutase [Bacteroidetes bacterium]|nr:UDP-galactopyranose mutase [Bacteroidota bacterium]